MILLSCAAACGARAEPSVTPVPLPFEVTEFRGPASRAVETVGTTDALRGNKAAMSGPAVLVWGKTGGAVVTLSGADLRTLPITRNLGDLSALDRGRGTVPAARVESAGPISVALADPGRDYPHEALGSAVHARTLVITERKPVNPGADAKPVPTDTTRIEAGPGAVFEDREPRLVDLDGDRVPEVLVLRSSKERGTQLLVIGKRGATWRVLAETPPDDEPFRWMNVAAAGDLGPGLPHAIALVRRPHLDGVLQVWRFENDGLSLVAERGGYANHAFGSPAQDLAALLPRAPGEPARLAIPVLDRRSLALVRLGPDRLEETARIPLPSRVQTGVAALGTSSDVHVLAGLEDGRLVDARP